MNQAKDKNAYYINFTTEMLVGAKELLKSMPAFYNKIYFSSKYTNALWNGDKEEVFQNVTLLTEEENIALLRQIIKANFLYIGDWDSLRFTDGEDYGFSFIGGHIKFVLMTFKETEKGYIIKSYDADTGDCYLTTIAPDKNYFLDRSMKENGEIIRTCDFNLEYINNNNTKVEKAVKKTGPEMILYTSKGYALTNMYIIISLAVLSVAIVIIIYYLLKNSII